MKGIQGICNDLAGAAASLLKVALLSRRPQRRGAAKKRDLVIMGNGPSLRETIDTRGSWLADKDLMAVNFFANTPDFKTLKPSLYILADGLFFADGAMEPNVERLWSNLAATDWKMTLWVPVKHLKKVPTEVAARLEVKRFNLTPVEGTAAVADFLTDTGLGMPRPRNVMIPAIMTAIRDGYRKIYLAGADHTWTRTLSVDDENFVVSVQPHFYKDNEEEHARVRKAYANLRLHDVLGSMTIAFRSYWQIARYAKKKGVEIINSTPGSMIDAFPREYV